MTLVKNKALDKTILVGRIIHHVQGTSKGPTMVFFAGLHGNETAGVFALEATLKTLNPEIINGTIYGVSGNLKALEKNQRYLDVDLNRLWTKSQLEARQSHSELNSEEIERNDVFQVLKAIIASNSGPFYFIDFHTTSSKTLPFITINDALINRKFSKLFPVPIVLGIEEYLNGPLLSYINELGYVSLGFESGQHDEKEAVDNCVTFIHLSLVFTEMLSKENSPQFLNHYQNLQRNAQSIAKIFEVTYLHQIKQGETFTMEPGFKSFQPVKKGTLLAVCDGKKITSPVSARLFMPLYQPKGAEGFFIIRPIQPFILFLSAILRRLKFDNLLAILPGISWLNSDKNGLKVNLGIARFYAKSIFHLLGYRNRQISFKYLVLHNRERTSKTNSYKSEIWY
ncbi:succinylglutamate desuccinylase/aspartoacylase family protein [Psychroserpens sp. BH13MA-6]